MEDDMFKALKDDLIYLGEAYSSMGLIIEEYDKVGVEVSHTENETLAFTYHCEDSKIVNMTEGLDDEVVFSINLKKETLDEVVKELKMYKTKGQKLAVCAKYRREIEVNSQAVKDRIKEETDKYFKENWMELARATKILGLKGIADLKSDSG